MSTPTVGRIVHYIEHPDSPCLAALVTGQADPRATRVNMMVVYDSPYAGEWRHDVMFDERKQHAHSWHWPERVEE